MHIIPFDERRDVFFVVQIIKVTREHAYLFLQSSVILLVCDVIA